MRAARLQQARGAVLIEEIPVPSPGPGEVLLKIQACGLCHSDLFICSLEKLPRTPLTLGHEAIGVVEQLGAGVGRLRRGDRVGLTYLFGSCGTCEDCRAGRPELCPRQVNTGYHVDGAFADYALARADHAFQVPEGLAGEEAAPLCCAGWTAYHAVRSAGLGRGHLLAVFGIGGLGHLAIQFARLEGLRVAAIDLSPEKLSLAQSLGAEITLHGGEEDPVRALKKAGGAHGAISFVASAVVIRQAASCLRRNGTLVLVGLAPGSLELPLVETVLKQIQVRGSFLGRQDELPQIFEMARRGDIQIHTQTCSLEALPQAMEWMEAGKLPGRMVVKFD